MTRSPISLRASILGAALCAFVAIAGGGAGAARAQAADAKAETIRPEVAKALQPAEEMIKAKKFQEALLAIAEAERIPDRTPFENYFIDRLRGAAALGAGDTALAARSLEASIASGRLSPQEQLSFIRALVGIHFKAGDYPKAATWAARYFKDGGTDVQQRSVLIRALYLSDNCAEAVKELRIDVEASEKAGPPPQEQLQMLLGCYSKMNDPAGVAFALDKLLAYYPTKEYWSDAIRRVEAKPGFADGLALDALRLRQATGTLTSASQYLAMAQLALKAGLPAEAKRAADQGFAAGVLGTGPDADAERRVRDVAARQMADDEKLLVQNAKDATAAKDGVGLVNVGFALVTTGQYDKGIAMMEQGIARGGLRRPDDVRLHLAIAYLAGGQKAKAVETFKSVQGGDGTAELARLWTIHAQRPAS
jgi:hypothetical protein